MAPANKSAEGIVIVIDVGPSVRASTETTFYSQAKSCLIHILQRKIFTEKCKDMAGIVLFGTDDTKNDLAKGNQYQHITVLQTPNYVTWDVIRLAQNLPHGNSQGDWLDALVVAMDLLHDTGATDFAKKNIVLLTDFSCDFTDDKANQIIQSLKAEEIDLTVIGPLLDEMEESNGVGTSDPSSSNIGTPSKPDHRHSSLNWNGKCKTPCQLAAEALIRRIVSEVDGITCTFDEAIPQLLFFEKHSRGSANWNAMLDIGPDFSIPIVGRIKVKRTPPTPWKKAYLEDQNAVIISETLFHKKDENQTVVDEEDVISGFRYGTTLVPFGLEDVKLQYSCEVPSAVLSILGFTRSSNVPFTLHSGDQVLVITAKLGDEDGAVALSALIQALMELDTVAITRRVYRKNLNPCLGVLFPDITAEYESLIWVGLPFQEDTRSFTFPSLKKWESRVTEEERELMDQLLTDMDLSATQDSEEGFDPTTIVNPQLQHYFNCLTHRALYPDQPLPSPAQHILTLLKPSEQQSKAVELLQDKMKRLFPTTKMENFKKKSKLILDATINEDTSAPEANPTLLATDLTRGPVHKISTATPVEDFMAMLQGDQPNYLEICRQMHDVLLQVTDSLTGFSSSDRVLIEKLLNALSVFRKEALVIDPAPFNTFARQLKQMIMTKAFLELWNHIVQENLGLIMESETLKSNVSAAEAEEFLKMEEETSQVSSTSVHNEQDYDDMLDDL